jgi:hypothetical protein
MLLHEHERPRDEPPGPATASPRQPVCAGGGLPRIKRTWAEAGISALIGAAFFLLLRATPYLPGGFDAYRHVRQAARYLTEPQQAFADPWRLAYFWPRPADAWFGYHMLLAPLTKVFDLLVTVKLLAAIVIAVTAYSLFVLLRHLGARYRAVWVLIALAGSSITLCRFTLTRPYLLSLLLTLLATLFTVRNQPLKLAIASAVHALSYSIFFLVGLGPGLWFLIRRDRGALRLLAASLAGIGAGLVCNPYFPENVRYDLMQSSVTEIATRAHVLIGGELLPITGWWWWLAASLPVVIPFAIAAVLRVRQLQAGVRVSGALAFKEVDLLFAASIITLAGAFRVSRTADFFVLFATVFAAAVLSPRLNAWKKDLPYLGVPLALLLAVYVYLTYLYVIAAPSLDRFRGAAEWLRTHARNELVADAQWGDYQFLYFLNPYSRYVVGIEPTMMYLADSRKYWLWRHVSDDETTTCGKQQCSASERIEAGSALLYGLGARYVFTEHAMNPRLEWLLHRRNGTTEVYRDAAYSVFRLDF